MPYTTVNNIQVYYELAGSGPRLLYISGTGGDLRKKPNVFDSPLADHFEILAYDQRGLGQTDRPNIAYTMADYANDATALMAAIGWDRAHVMGVSFGGMVGQEFAIRYSQKVDKMVMACTSSGGAGEASYPLHTMIDLSPEEWSRALIPLADTRCDATWQAANPDEFEMMVTWSREMGKIGADEPNRKIGARRQIEARAQHDTYDRLPQITHPVFVCGGRFDGIAPPHNLDAITQQIPNATQQLFDGGHGFLAQDPAAYEAIIRFLKE